MKIPNIRLLNQQLLSPLFYGKVGNGNAFEVSNDSNCGKSTA